MRMGLVHCGEESRFEDRVGLRQGLVFEGLERNCSERPMSIGKSTQEVELAGPIQWMEVALRIEPHAVVFLEAKKRCEAGCRVCLDTARLVALL
jgi:hypothetical protein